MNTVVISSPGLNPSNRGAGFPNRAGNHHDNDDVLAAELEAAGITVKKYTWMLDHSGEVRTSVVGSLGPWDFKRAWYYWVCKGPGIPLDVAKKLDSEHGKTVRASGDCACRGPEFWNEGFGTSDYHVDSPEGLAALAEAIKSVWKQRT
jgi:hypothetical protein